MILIAANLLPQVNPPMRFGTFAIAATLLFPCVSVLAQDRWDSTPPPRVIEDVLQLEMIAFAATFDSSARVDADPETPGTLFSGEGDFGLEDAKVLPQVELTLLPGIRHLLRFSSIRARRSGSAILEREIEYEGDLFEEGAEVDSSLDIYMTGVTYGYQFLRRDRGHLAATVGIHLGEIKTNAEVRGELQRQPTGETSPLALVGLEGAVNLARRWSLEGRFSYTSLSVDLIEASMFDARVALLWRLNPHLAFGAAYRRLALEAESLEEDSAGFVDLDVSGPLLFVRASL